MAEVVTVKGDQCERCRVLLHFILNNADLLALRLILVMTKNPTSMLAPWLAVINSSLETDEVVLM